MKNQQGAPEALRPIARYKIGYHTDEWGVRSSTPGGISDPSGQWVLYKDHLAALASHGQTPARADMQDAYVGAREDLAIWKRRALEAERDLRAERETASRLAAEINAINGPTHLGEPAPTAQPAPAQAAPAAVAGPSEFPHEQMDAVALARYKVVPSHESMLHRHVVVAGDGSQQLYIGREVECENMARKFAGAFLDGAFAFHSMLDAAPTTQPAPQQEAASVDLKTMELAESVGLIGPASRTNDLHAAIQRFHDLICANATIKAAQMAAEAISESAPQQGGVCDKAPAGWLCTRQHEHEGPCAAEPTLSARSDEWVEGYAAGVRDGWKDALRTQQAATTPQAESQPAPLHEGEWINDAGRIKWLLWRVQDLEAQLAARPPAYSVQDLQPVHDAVTIDLLNERVAYLERKLKEADSVLEDAARLDWLLLRISGAEFRRIGVHYSGNARRADVDAARKQGANHD